MDALPPLALSVIIPTYDEPDLLRGALRSLSVQHYPPAAVEIVVIDDASPHFDTASVREAAGAFPLQVIRHSVNQGRARARNAGIRAASGEVVVFLDSDMTVEPDFLQQHAALHRAQEHCVGIGQIRFGTQIPPSALTRYIESRGVQGLEPGERVPFKCFVTGNSSARREVLLGVGLFDEDFTAYGGEDLELGYRLHRAGLLFHYLPGALSHHHHLRSLDPLCTLMRTYGRRSLPLLLRKHPELAGLVQLDFLEESRLALRRLLFRAALLPPVYHLILRLTHWGLGHRVPALFFSYLWWYNRTRGYLEAVDGSGDPPLAHST